VPVPDEIRRRARVLAWGYALVAVLLLPWMVYLFVTLPTRNLDTHYRLSWIGFDVFLVAAMARTAYLAFRLLPRIELPAAATATLLMVDAWFDVTTAHGRKALLVALGFAVFAELPMAALSVFVARRANQRLVSLAGLSVPAAEAGAVAEALADAEALAEAEADPPG
jgi:hypothetical protein